MFRGIGRGCRQVMGRVTAEGGREGEDGEEKGTKQGV